MASRIALRASTKIGRLLLKDVSSGRIRVHDDPRTDGRTVISILDEELAPIRAALLEESGQLSPRLTEILGDLL